MEELHGGKRELIFIFEPVHIRYYFSDTHCRDAGIEAALDKRASLAN